MAADGSIIIDTRIQTEGLSKGLNTIKAALTGQKTFTKAIGVQEDYAASLDKTWWR